MLGGFLHICICTCTIYCGLWPPDNTSCIFLTWYQSLGLFFFGTRNSCPFLSDIAAAGHRLSPSSASSSLTRPVSPVSCRRSSSPAPSPSSSASIGSPSIPSPRPPIHPWSPLAPSPPGAAARPVPAWGRSLRPSRPRSDPPRRALLRLPPAWLCWSPASSGIDL
jgi:hypothetical protein